MAEIHGEDRHICMGGPFSGNDVPAEFHGQMGFTMPLPPSSPLSVGARTIPTLEGIRTVTYRRTPLWSFMRAATRHYWVPEDWMSDGPAGLGIRMAEHIDSLLRREGEALANRRSRT